MVDITIHQCTLRIVRHGGWSWGPEPRKLLQLAIKALPELLEAELAKLWPDDVELEFTDPVCISVPLRMAELMAATGWSGAFNPTPTPPELQAFGQRIAVAARKAFVSERSGFVETFAPPTHVDNLSELSLTQPRQQGNAVFEVLRSWHNEGVLAQRLSAFSLAALRAWSDRLIANVKTSAERHQPMSASRNSQRRCTNTRSGEIDSPSSDIDSRSRQIDSHNGEKNSQSSEMIQRLVEAGATALSKSPADHGAMIRRRLMILTDVMVQLEINQCTNDLLAALDRLLPLPDRADSEEDQANSTLAHGRSEQSASLPHAQGLNSTSMRPSGQVHKDRTGEVVAGGIENIRAVSKSELHAAMGLSQQKTSAAAEGNGGARSDFSLTTTVQHRVESEHSETMAAQSGPSDVSSARALAALKSQTPLQAKVHPPVLQQEAARPLHSPGVRELFEPESTHRVVSALPFMLLGPLSRIGYLQALAATLEATDAVAASPLFAAALAYKVLAPPARGWRREPNSIAAATTFAGLNLAASEPSLVQLARHLADHLSPLDAVLAGALIGGHNQQQPLLLLRVGENAKDGFLLLDVEGTLAIQWAADVADLRQVLVQLDSSLVLVPQSSADAKVLRWLDDEGFQFVTDAIPIRGEKWRSLRLQQERWWTNDAIRSDTSLIKAARSMLAAADEAATIWNALSVQRPGVPLADDPRLDRHLTLAASTALGTVAWELWRTRELTSPQLALERFGDFEAQVTWKRDEVRVSLPLGKRFQDLRDHGLLDDVGDVPWFNGRTLVFSSG